MRKTEKEKLADELMGIQDIHEAFRKAYAPLNEEQRDRVKNYVMGIVHKIPDGGSGGATFSSSILQP